MSYPSAPTTGSMGSLPGSLLSGNPLFFLIAFVIALIIGVLLVLIGYSMRSKGTRTAGGAFLVGALIAFIIAVVLALLGY